MEQYKEKMKVSCRITGLLCLILVGFSIFCLCAEAGLVELTPVAGDSHWQSRWRGFISGAAMGIAIYMAISLAKSLRAMKDEKKLKALYIKEHDERSQVIYTAARAAAMQFCSGLGLVAVIISGYFDIKICLSIFACLWVLVLAGIGFKFYYSRKF